MSSNMSKLNVNMMKRGSARRLCIWSIDQPIT